MTFATINKTSRRLIGAKPLQSYLHCSPALSDCRPILRSQLLGWRVTCPSCGELLSDLDGLEVASPFLKYRQAALHGERLLDAEAERGKSTWPLNPGQRFRKFPDSLTAVSGSIFVSADMACCPSNSKRGQQCHDGSKRDIRV